MGNGERPSAGFQGPVRVAVERPYSRTTMPTQPHSIHLPLITLMQPTHTNPPPPPPRPGITTMVLGLKACFRRWVHVLWLWGRVAKPLVMLPLPWHYLWGGCGGLAVWVFVLLKRKWQMNSL